MKISFHGAAQTVTGSKHLLTLESGHKVLLDCGLFQGLGQDTIELNGTWGFEPEELDFVILSHAHVDHSGLLPKLVKDGFRGTIYSTPSTYDLCEIMLADSAHIQEADIRFVNKRRRSRGQKPLEPIYELEDVWQCLSQFEQVPYDRAHKVNDFIQLTFTNNGHILGSASVTLRIREGSRSFNLTFTGDIGRYNSSLLKDPAAFEQSEYIICESTYGDRLHSDQVSAEQLILDTVVQTCEGKGGRVVIPAFSLGRTQEIVYALNKLNLHGLLPDVNIFVDSPLAVNATRIMRNHKSSLNRHVQRFIESRPDPFGFDMLHYITDKKWSQKLNEYDKPCVIISASGMAEAGRIKHHLMRAIPQEKNTVLLVGYAEPLSLAGKLRSGHKEVKIYGDMYEVNAEVRVIDSFSAHGDYEEMIQYLSCQDPKLVEKMFLVHGQLEPQKAFKNHLKDAGFNNIFIPEQHQEYFV